jgi:prepilin-type N-terminal cleavage/methylation domain-containing protein
MHGHMRKRSQPGDRRSSHADGEPCTTGTPLGTVVEVDPGQGGPVTRDRGVSLIEVLISIVLIGLVVGATLSLLRVTIMASSTDRDHSNAHAWLQTAADVLYARPLEPCAPAVTHAGSPATNKADIISRYETTLQQTGNPEGWPNSNIRIYDLQFWHINKDPVTKFTQEGWGNLCDTLDTDLQRVGIEVRSATGEIVERVEVIIGE